MASKSEEKNDKWLKRSEPLFSPEEDKLFKKFLTYVENTIRSVESPFVIGLSGEWGKGKTTLFNFLEKDLEKDFAIVRFDSWKFQKTENLSYSFVEHVISDLRRSGNKAIKRKIDKILQFSVALADSLGVSVSTKVVNVKPEFSKIYENIKRIYSSIKDIETDFQEIVKTLLSKKKKSIMLVFIDDLDRCLPEFSLSFLENIKHFFAVKKVVFLVAMDEVLLETALQIRYKSKDFTSKVYLEKIFDLFIRLPYYEAKNIREYIEFLCKKKYSLDEFLEKKQYEDLVKLVEGIPKIENSGILTNPRKLDRILKVFVRGIRSIPEKSIIHESYSLFFLMLALREYYYEIFSYIQNNESNANIILSTFAIKTGESKFETRKGTFSFGDAESHRKRLDSLGELFKEFYQGPNSSEIAELLVETYRKEFEDGKFGASISNMHKNLHKLAKEINIYFY
ncbi:MAG: hypothetical protein JW924_02920 [Fusobacteriaceae bacterium]|nr:hypothetical protein [Fusobacteriaceae bacterium]